MKKVFLVLNGIKLLILHETTFDQVVRSLLHSVLMLASKKNKTIDKHYVVYNFNQGRGWGLITHISWAITIMAGWPSDK